MQQFQSNGEPCPLVVDNAGINTGIDTGAELPVGFDIGNPAASGSGPAVHRGLLQPFNPNQAMPSMIPAGQAFNVRDLSTYPNTFDPAASIGATSAATFNGNFQVPLGHVIRPAAPFGYQGCDGYILDKSGRIVKPAMSQAPPPGTPQTPPTQLQQVPQAGSFDNRNVFKPVDNSAPKPVVQTLGSDQGRFSRPFQGQSQFMGPVQGNQFTAPVQGNSQFSGPVQGSQQFSQPIMNQQFLSPPNGGAQQPIQPIQPAVPFIQQPIQPAQPQVPFQQGQPVPPSAQFANVNQNLPTPVLSNGVNQVNPGVPLNSGVHFLDGKG